MTLKKGRYITVYIRLIFSEILNLPNVVFRSLFLALFALPTGNGFEWWNTHLKVILLFS